MTTTIKFNNGATYHATIDTGSKRFTLNGRPLKSFNAYIAELKTLTLANCTHGKRTKDWYYNTDLPYSERSQVYNRLYTYTPLTKRGKCDKCGLMVTPNNR